MREMKFHQKPFEWAYEGLAPLLVKDVLQTQRGIGLSLTMLFAAVGSRLGVHLLPCPLSATGGGSVYLCLAYMLATLIEVKDSAP